MNRLAIAGLFTAATIVVATAFAPAVLSGPGTQGPTIMVENEELANTIGALTGVKPPPANLSEYIVDPVAAAQLGKALFWDIQVGSNGVACASCHFHAGADIRTRNQVDPGVKAGDAHFDGRKSGPGTGGPNKQYGPADWPFHSLQDTSDRNSQVLFDTNDVFSSSGSLGGDFISSPTSLLPKSARVGRIGIRNRLPTNEKCNLTYDPANNPFHFGGLIYRKVEPRQTPTVVNAVFNVRQFWDGRANNAFNGVDPFGARTFQKQTSPDGPGNPGAAKAGTLVDTASHPTGAASLRLEQRLIENASLASQAVGPPLSDFEMSCAGKTFADLGRKLIPLQPLARQRVHHQDSLFSKTPSIILGTGLKGTYRALIEKAFAPKFWANQAKVTISATGQVAADAAGFTQMEHNFSLFWGLAIMSYEALLVSDDTPFDRAMKGDRTAMSEEARAGQIIFQDRGQCINCHFGPLFSGATATSSSKPKPIEHMRAGNGAPAFYDTGFYNIGVRPTTEDLGVGATDPYGFDLSYSRQFKWRQIGKNGRGPDKFNPSPCSWIIQYWPCDTLPQWTTPGATERDAVDGAFKTPILRNVGLNPPYFHNGGQSNLKDVVRFYNRGGDRRGPLDKDTSGLTAANEFGQTNDSNLDPDIGDPSPSPEKKSNALGLTETELDYLVQFLLSLTDERVACHSDVFDHPELPLSLGQQDVAVKGTIAAKDIVGVLPAVGAKGLKGIGKPCFPNSGDLFGSVNKFDKTPLQTTFDRIIDAPEIGLFSAISSYLSGADPTNILSLATTAPASTTAPTSTTATTTTTTSTTSASVTSTTTSTVTSTTSNPATVGTTTASSAQTATVQTAALNPTKNGVAKPTTTTTATAAAATAALVVPTPPPVPAPQFTAPVTDIHGFDITGFVGQPTVSGKNCPDLPKRQWGGTVVVNGLSVTIPCNLIVQMPAATYTWAELFPPSAGGVGTAGSGLTLVSTNGQPAVFPPPSMEIHVIGNIVAGRYVAGLVYMSQQSVNVSFGTIAGIDYAKGLLLVSRAPGQSGTVRVRINDAGGRFSAGQSPDPRFNVDDVNPTIRAATGYPMCVPRSDPTVTDDPRCPQRNRPKVATGCRSFALAGIRLPTGFDLARPLPGQVYCSGFVMGPTGSATADQPIASEQAPFEIGDSITFSGTLLQESDGETVWAHTIVANVGIFTQPGTLPSYVAIGEFRIGNFTPQTLVNGVVQELQDRLVLEAFVTDVLSIADIYLVDVDPATGSQTQRWVTPGSMTGGVGAVGSNGHIIDGGITTQFAGAQPGRVRIRANKAVPGILDSPTRYLRVVVRSLCDPANVNGTAALLGTSQQVACLERVPAANGLFAGQYLAPVGEFLLPENVLPGDRPLPNNLWDLGFLMNGEGPGTGRLQPTPW